jgi:hypothetical protein
MSENKLDQLLKILQDIKNLRDNKNEDEEDEEGEEEESLCPYLKSLKEDYTDFAAWCFGSEDKGLYKESIKNAKLRWKRLHPSLEIPRIFQTNFKLEHSDMQLLLVLDAYPLFLKEKESKK